ATSPSNGRPAGCSVAETESNSRLSVRTVTTRPRCWIWALTWLAKPCALAYASIRYLSASNWDCSRLAACASAAPSPRPCWEGLGMLGVSGSIAGTSAVAGVCDLVDAEPDWMIARPPGRIEPENAAFSDSCSVWYLEMFTDEIENSTM